MDKKKLEEMINKMDVASMSETLKKINANTDLGKFQDILKDQLKIFNPKSKKDSIFNGKSISVSMTNDNRIILNFACEDDSNMFYDTLKNDLSNHSNLNEEIKKLLESEYVSAKKIDALNKEISTIKSLNFYKLSKWFKII